MSISLQDVFMAGDDYVGLVLRLTLAIMILPHAFQKVFGWFGGHGLKGTMGYFTGVVGLPAIIGALVIMGEFIGGFSVLLGAGTRIGAVWVGFVMLGALLKVHLPNGFFMNWGGQAKGEGVEFFILALGIVAALAINGGGAFSLDHLISNVLH